MQDTSFHNIDDLERLLNIKPTEYDYEIFLNKFYQENGIKNLGMLLEKYENLHTINKPLSQLTMNSIFRRIRQKN